MARKRYYNKSRKRSGRGNRSFNSQHSVVKSIRAASNQEPKENVKNVEYEVTHAFSDFQLVEPLQKNITRKGFSKPTPIQDQAIPPLLEGKDVIGIAHTGTGKTGAFLIPLINKTYKNQDQRVLIMSPTRELAGQINSELTSLTQNMGIKSALCIGGANKNRQISRLHQKPQFVIGTPGRLIDLVKSKKLNLTEFQSVVLDEADRMVDIGFVDDVKFLVKCLANNRQSLCFSATLSPQIKDILDQFVRNPVRISVKKQDTTSTVQQEVIDVNRFNKVDRLHEMLQDEAFEKVLVFGRTKRGVQRLTGEMRSRGLKADAIHGDKRQNQRQATLKRFQKNQIDILIATDVASRGLDIEGITHVINYDLPDSFEDYVHRIGRTGRAGKSGKAVTFVE